MDKYIVNSTAQKPLGIPTGQNCLIVPEGQYAGRMAILYASTSGTISLVTADPPYHDFSSPVEVTANAADTPFDVAFGDDGDILVVFIGDAAGDLRLIRLTFSGGSWAPGSPTVVYDGSEASYPVIRRISTKSFWIFYTRQDQGSFYVCGKVSDNEGTAWTPSSDPGDILTSGAASAYSLMVESGICQYVVYTEGGSKIACRYKPNGGMVWGSETILSSEGGYSDNFHAAVSSDGRIGLAYVSSSGLKFREYNGSYWTAETALDNGDVSCPVVKYQSGTAFVLYLRQDGESLNKNYFVKQETIGFSDPVSVDPRRSELNSVLLYNAAAGTYQDRTDEANSADAADLFHTGSNALLAGVGDAVFLGCERPFDFINLVLSTTGAGGEVVWKYWDGQNWKAFTPASGVWQFSTGTKELLLWNDFASIPSDWQKNTVSGVENFWICATVISNFNTAVVGSRINAISNLITISAQV